MTIEQRLEQVEQQNQQMQLQNQKIQRTNKRLTVALTMMAMVAITIQLSACGEDSAGPSTNCDVSDVGALAGRNLSECDLVNANLEGANLRYADLKVANLEGAVSVPELSA